MMAQLDLFATPPAPPEAAPAPFLTAPLPAVPAPAASATLADFASIPACEVGKRAAEIAITGGHSLDLTGDAEACRLVADAANALWRFVTPNGVDEIVFIHAPPRPRLWDVFVDMWPISDVDRRLPPPAETSAMVAERIFAARKRLKDWPRYVLQYPVAEPARKLLDDAMRHWDARGLKLDEHKVLSVAATVAALADCESIGRIHVAEALSYQPSPPSAPEPQPEPQRDGHACFDGNLEPTGAACAPCAAIQEKNAAAPQPVLEPAPAAPVERSPHYQAGAEARAAGRPRQLPGYFMEPERDPRWKRARERGIADWLAGWDEAPDVAPITLPLQPDAATYEPDAAAAVREIDAKLTPAERGRFVAQLAARLAGKRQTHETDSAKEKKAKAARLLDRTDVRRAFRTVRPRSEQALVDDAWAVVSEYDRLQRDPRAGKEFADRIRQLSQALDELMIEANGCSRTGCAVYHGPKRLVKALRVRARAEGRWPMWGVEGRYRFQWRGLTMIRESRWGGIHLDADRHAPGTLCHSSSGYRSFTGTRGMGGDGAAGMSPEDYGAAVLESFFNADTKHGNGLGGKLVPYYPWWADHYRQALRYHLEATPDYRRDHPAMHEPDERARYWAEHDAKFAAQEAEARARAAAIGFDLDGYCGALKPAQAALL